MANQDNCMRVTRSKRIVAKAMPENPQHPPPPNKKRVVLGEISSNVLGNTSLRSCSEARTRGRSRKDVKGVQKVATDDVDAGSDDPQICGPYVAGIYEYLRNMESEVNFLGRLSHPNLVKLLGYCWEDKELLLVYEYLPKGSLENHLFRRNTSTEPLSWNRRISIALGVARGLAFLHNLETQVIYRDFKASNILLDVNYDAKISDFGLAKLGPSGGNSHVTTRIMGTYGYAAPEYIATAFLPSVDKSNSRNT